MSLRVSRVGAGAALLLVGALSTTPAVAAVRWGLDAGVQWSEFTWRSPAVADFPDAPYRVATATGGVRCEWPTTRHLALGASLRYDTWAAGQQLTVFPFNGLPSATAELEFQELVLAPSARFTPGRGFGISLGPEIAFVLRTISRAELGVSPAAAITPRRAQGTIFEQVGTLAAVEVTSRYRRWLPAFGVGLSWEHAVLGHGLRWGTEYRRMLQEPSRGGGRVSMAAWRAGLTVFL